MSATTAPKGLRPRIAQRLFRPRPEDALPHRVTHHRVYIVPSRRGLAFLFSLALMLVGSINYSLSLGYALSFVLTGLFAASLLHTYKNLAGLEVRSIETASGFCGSAVAFQFSLHNSSTESRQGIQVRCRHGTTSMTALGAEQTVVAQLPVPARQRGRLTLGRVSLQSDWPIGMWTCWSYLHVPIDALVYPVQEPDPPPLPSRPTGESGDHRATSFDGEPGDIRAYRPGDAPSAIAWKIVAKGQGLHVRQFERSRAPAAVELSLQATAQPELEAQLSRLSAWVVRAHASNTEFSLDLPGLCLRRARGEQHHRRALEALALYGIEP